MIIFWLLINILNMIGACFGCCVIVERENDMHFMAQSSRQSRGYECNGGLRGL